MSTERIRITTASRVYEVDAEGVFDAARICGLGSGDIALAKFELLGPSYATLKALLQEARQWAPGSYPPNHFWTRVDAALR